MKVITPPRPTFEDYCRHQHTDKRVAFGKVYALAHVAIPEWIDDTARRVKRQLVSRESREVQAAELAFDVLVDARWTPPC